MLVTDDCLFAMRKMKAETVDMAYLDPPFFTQKIQSLKNRDGHKYYFSDKWDSMDAYLSYLKSRIIEVRRVLKASGSIFLHCDHSASHHLRLLLDEIFGAENFRSEIIWIYRRWSNSRRGPMNSHQTIFFYSKSKNFTYNTIYTAYSPTTNIDQILQDRIRDSRGKAAYKTDSKGNAICTNEKKGVPLSDVWDIPFLNPKAKERVGYPTQKPILLLERIVEMSTNEKDVVLDPFCGSGTALVAASLLNRNYIGIDVSGEAAKLAQKRLDNPVKTESALMRLGKESYDLKDELEKQILNNFECNIVQRNKGIDAFLVRMYDDAPVPIRIQKKNESLSEAARLLHRAGATKGCKRMILIRTNNDNSAHIKMPAAIVVMDSYQIILNNWHS